MQALLIAWAGSRGRLAFAWRSDLRHGVGAFLVFYAIGLYPILGEFLGHEYPAAPSFGITPCPLTVYTLGLLLWATRLPVWITVIPVLWAFIGTIAAWHLGMAEDLGLIAAAALAVGLWTIHREPFRRKPETPPE